MSFDNTFVRELPGDKETSNNLRQVHFFGTSFQGAYIYVYSGGYGATSGRPRSGRQKQQLMHNTCSSLQLTEACGRTWQDRPGGGGVGVQWPGSDQQ
jgi:hypothetical protein